MRGYSLIECLCSLALVGILLSGIAVSTHKASSILGSIANSVDERVSIVKTAAVLSAALSALERSHISGLVSITDGSDPTTPSGAAHPVAGLSGTSRPRANSSVLSAIEVDPSYRGRIVRSVFDGELITIDICGAPNKPSSDQFRSHLVIGLSGACQITGTPNQISTGCFQISGRLLRGLISSGCPSVSLLEYLPVIREFSIHVDRSGELRLISHVGSRILENQPMVRGLRSISIVELTNPDLSPSFYQIGIDASLARQHRFLFASALARSPLWNEVLL